MLQKMKFLRNCWRTHYLMFLTTLIVTVKMTVTLLLLEIGKTKLCIVYRVSDSEQSANESDDDTLDSAVSTWGKTDKT